MSIGQLMKEAYHIMDSTPADIHPQNVLEDFTPLTKGQYPIFNKYPKFVVDYQVSRLAVVVAAAAIAIQVDVLMTYLCIPSHAMLAYVYHVSKKVIFYNLKQLEAMFMILAPSILTVIASKRMHNVPPHLSSYVATLPRIYTSIQLGTLFSSPLVAVKRLSMV